MLIPIEARLMAGFGHHGGLRHGNLLGLHILGVLLALAACFVFAGIARAIFVEWTGRRWQKEDSGVAAGWAIFVIVLAGLVWVVHRVV
ncbi:MAG TPA: hypothetical protein VGF97_09440 [Rhizomicrobium sp.]|jgi:hypothetical protein